MTMTLPSASVPLHVCECSAWRPSILSVAEPSFSAMFVQAAHMPFQWSLPPDDLLDPLSSAPRLMSAGAPGMMANGCSLPLMPNIQVYTCSFLAPLAKRALLCMNDKTQRCMTGCYRSPVLLTCSQAICKLDCNLCVLPLAQLALFMLSCAVALQCDWPFCHTAKLLL